MAANNDWITAILMVILRTLPMFIVWFIGLVIALVRWPRCPGVSALVLAAIAVSGVTSIATQVFYTMLPRFGESLHSAAAVAQIVSIASSLVHAGAWGCLLTAAFMGRNAVPDQATIGEAIKTPTGKP